jgi:hypothetical protein
MTLFLSRLYRRLFYGETAFKLGLLLGELFTKRTPPWDADK